MDVVEGTLLLETELKKERQTTDILLKDIKHFENAIKQQDKQIHKLDTELAEMKAQTAYKKGSVKTAGELEGKLQQLKLTIMQLEEEKKSNKHIYRKKLQLIETLSKELNNTRQLEEQLYQHQNTIKVKDKELSELNEELIQARQAYERKHKQLILEEEKKLSAQNQQLSYDKSQLKAEIAKYLEIKRENDRILKSQQQRVEMLQAKFDFIMQCAKDLKIDRALGDALRQLQQQHREQHQSSVDAVEVEPVSRQSDERFHYALFDLLQRSLRALNQQLALKEVMIQEKDSNIEALEKKFETLQQNRRSEIKNMMVERKEYNTQIDDLTKALELQGAAYRKHTNQMQKENVRLKRKVANSPKKDAHPS